MPFHHTTKSHHHAASLHTHRVSSHMGVERSSIPLHALPQRKSTIQVGAHCASLSPAARAAAAPSTSFPTHRQRTIRGHGTRHCSGGIWHRRRRVHKGLSEGNKKEGLEDFAPTDVDILPAGAGRSVSSSTCMSIRTPCARAHGVASQCACKGITRERKGQKGAGSTEPARESGSSRGPRERADLDERRHVLVQHGPPSLNEFRAEAPEPGLSATLEQFLDHEARKSPSVERGTGRQGHCSVWSRLRIRATQRAPARLRRWHACSRCCKSGGSSRRGPRMPDRQWRQQGETEATEGKLSCG